MGERVVVGHHAAVVDAERDDAGAGERREVDHGLRLVATGVVQRIAEDQAALGVRVQDLHRDAGGAGDDVARLDGTAARHVLAGRHETDHIERQVERGHDGHRAEDGGGTRHVELHLVHGARVLEGDAAGVEGDALADEHHGCTRAALGLVFEHDELRRLLAALRDREEAAHLLGADVGFLEDADPQRGMASGERTGLLGEVGRRADIAREVREVAHHAGAGARGLTVDDAATGGGGARRAHRTERDAREGGRCRLRAGLEVVDPVERGVDGLSGRTTEEVIVEFTALGAGEGDRGARAAGARQRADRGHQCAAPVAARDGRVALADQQDARRLEARRGRQQQRLGETAREVAALEEAADRAARSLVERRRRIAQHTAIVHADDEAVGLALREVAGEDVDLHGSAPERGINDLLF